MESSEGYWIGKGSTFNDSGLKKYLFFFLGGGLFFYADDVEGDADDIEGSGWIMLILKGDAAADAGKKMCIFRQLL